MIRNIIGQSKSSFDFRKSMDEGKDTPYPISQKEKCGEENSNCLGLILVPKILMAAMSRQDVRKKKRRDFLSMWTFKILQHLILHKYYQRRVSIV